MKSQQILIVVTILATLWQTAEAQPKKKRTAVDTPPQQSVLAGTGLQSTSASSDLTAVKPEMPLGPRDVLKSYEIAMGIVADKTSADFSAIVRAQQANQITREQAEYLLQQSYQMAMMQYQVLNALHEVLKHEIDEAASQQAMQQQARQRLNPTDSDTVLVVPSPGSAWVSR